MSLGAGGVETLQDSWAPHCSADSRFVTFLSAADDLVPGDTNGYWDAFVYDSIDRSITRVSVATDGTQADAPSWGPQLSADGRFVSYYSSAANLDPLNPSRGGTYLHDRQTGQTICVSVPRNAPPRLRPAEDVPLTRGAARYPVRLARSAPGDVAATAFDCTETPVPEPPVISADGRFVAFNSSNPDLVPDDTNGTQDVFVYDREAGTVERVSLRPDGSESPCMSWVGSISGDGRRVAFTSFGSMTDLIAWDREVYVWDRQTRTSVHASLGSDGQGGNGISYCDHAGMSLDGRRVAFLSFASNLVPGDDNGQWDIFLRDLETGELRRIDTHISSALFHSFSIPSYALSPDGRQLMFMSDWGGFIPGDTNDLPDLLVQDLETGDTRRVSGSMSGEESNGASEGAAMSADGRFVVFASHASNLTSDHNYKEDIFAVRLDLLPPQTGTAVLPAEDPEAGALRGSLSHRGWQANGNTWDLAVSEDGSVVAFTSSANNLVPGDTNEEEDVFVRDRKAGTTTRVSVSSSGEPATKQCRDLAISGDGRWIAFVTASDNLVANDRNLRDDVFVHDRQTGTTVRGSLADSGAEPDGESSRPSLSRDGRYLAFLSRADNMIPGRAFDDVFVRDLQQNRTVPCTVNTAGQGSNVHGYTPRMSAGGRYVVYSSYATNLDPRATQGGSQIFLRDLIARTTEWVSPTDAGTLAGGGCYDPDVSEDGRRIVFKSGDSTLVTGDTNGKTDVFLHDRDSGRTRRISVAGAQADQDCEEPRISADGRFVVFLSESTTLGNANPEGLRGAYLHDVETGMTEPLGGRPRWAISE